MAGRKGLGGSRDSHVFLDGGRLRDSRDLWGWRGQRALGGPRMSRVPRDSWGTRVQGALLAWWLFGEPMTSRTAHDLPAAA
jgi:hypothetical protein